MTLVLVMCGEVFLQADTGTIIEAVCQQATQNGFTIETGTNCPRIPIDFAYLPKNHVRHLQANGAQAAVEPEGV